MTEGYSLCIPRVFNNIPDAKIKSTFENLNLGKVGKIDTICKIGRKDGLVFKMAFVHFEHWNYYNSAAINLRQQIEDPNVIAKIVYDDPWYWILLPNHSNVAAADNSQHINSLLNVGDISPIIKTNTVLEERIVYLEHKIQSMCEEIYQNNKVFAEERRKFYECNNVETDVTDNDYIMNSQPEESIAPLLSTRVSETDLNTSLIYNSNIDDGMLHEEPNIVPMTISELDTSSICNNDNNVNIQVNTDIDISRYHEDPYFIPFRNTSYSDDEQYDEQYSLDLDSDDESISSDTLLSHEPVVDKISYSYDPYGDDTLGEETSSSTSYDKMVSQNKKLWVTANYCGND
jgi:hypothetical protein